MKSKCSFSFDYTDTIRGEMLAIKWTAAIIAISEPNAFIMGYAGHLNLSLTLN